MNNIFKLHEPSFTSRLTDLIIELDHLRRKELRGTTPTAIFFQLKAIFHMLESIGSARIEGNRTTIAEYIETKLDIASNSSQSIKEIDNMLQTIEMIDEYIQDAPISKTFISQIHQKVVEGLLPPPAGEGDYTPGAYRQKPVTIQKSKHKPPDFTQINDYMDNLIEFINCDVPSKYDLIKVAQAHHQFVWIHPFTNGNGRTVRILTYAMLVKYDFKVNKGRILNPSAIFCIDRDKYYDYLSMADSGTESGINQWCEYVLDGLKNEISKIDNLSDYSFLKEKILKPALKYSLERQLINKDEFSILNIAVDKKVIQASDINFVFQNKQPPEVSRQIKKLIKKKMLTPIEEKGRRYVMSFDNNYLLRGVIKSLEDNGFVSFKD